MIANDNPVHNHLDFQTKTPLCKEVFKHAQVALSNLIENKDSDPFRVNLIHLETSGC